MTVVIGTTLASFAMSEFDAWSSWLKHHERQRMSHPDGVEHFAALQTDARGIEPFRPLIEVLDEMGAGWWTYSLDDGRTEITMTNRWRHIVVGQNLVVDYCQARPDVSYLLFLAADCAAPSDIIPRMLEMEHPLVAPYISTYGLRGEVVPGYPPEWGVEDAMASAAAIFIARDVFRAIRWRWDADAGLSDDPAYHHDAKTLLGIPTHVRHDVLARHYPEAVGGYDTRFTAEALEVAR
jgi:hypothetical protein